MGKKRALFEDDDEEEEEEQEQVVEDKTKKSKSSSSSSKAPRMEINEKYAKEYEERKARELLSNKRAYSLFTQAEDLGEDGAEASSEDEDAEELTPQLDDQIQRTIAMIRDKDPSIYRKDFTPFSQSDKKQDKQQKKDKEKKPVLYQDLIREKIKRGEAVDEDDDDEEDDDAGSKNNNNPSYFEEQAKLKRDFQLAAKDDDGDDDDSDGGFELTMKPATALSQHDLPPAISKQEEDFLFKYLADRNQWSTSSMPSSASASASSSFKLMEDDDEDEERAEDFEQQFMFRHLAPGATEIVSHGRTVEGSLRRKDTNSRKHKREEAEERKRALADSKKEELKRLKNLKRKMIEKELVEAFGQHAAAKEDALLAKFRMEDLEGDFDPQAWDAKMSQVFDDEYYGEEDAEFEQEMEGEEEAAAVPAAAAAEGEGEGEVEEAYEEEEEPEQRPPTKRELKQMVEERLEREMADEELNNDEPEFKFHYRPVQANDYGIDEIEVLQATNQELNGFVSLKRMAPYAEREWLASAQHRKKFRDKLKARREEAAQTTSKKEKERLRVAKNRFEKSKQATVLAGKVDAKPQGMSSARLKSFGQ